MEMNIYFEDDKEFITLYLSQGKLVQTNLLFSLSKSLIIYDLAALQSNFHTD